MEENTLRKLYSSEIEEFANRRGANTMIVKAFLENVEFNETSDAAIVNLRLYKYSKATRNAIIDGIIRAIKRPVKV